MQNQAKTPIDPLRKSWLNTLKELGKLPRGQAGKQALKGDAYVKALFLTNKKNILDLWEIYTQHRDELSRKMLSGRSFSVAYLLGFHQANIARMQTLVNRSNDRCHWIKSLKNQSVHVFDFGCGTGALSAVMSQLLNPDSTTLYDESGPLLDAAKLIHKGLDSKNVRGFQLNLSTLKPEWFIPKEKDDVHIYLMGYVWNELARNKPAIRRLADIFASHEKNGEKALLFIVEPAVEDLSRDTMALRDSLTSLGYQALYPCPHSQDCPMLERAKDWCYSEGTWVRDSLLEWIDRKLDINRSTHAASMFAFASSAMGLESKETSVVVGRPVKTSKLERYKGHYELLICNADGIDKLEPNAPKQIPLRGSEYRLEE